MSRLRRRRATPRRGELAPGDRAAALMLYEGDLLADVDAHWATLPRMAAREAYGRRARSLR